METKVIEAENKLRDKLRASDHLNLSLKKQIHTLQQEVEEKEKEVTEKEEKILQV